MVRPPASHVPHPNQQCVICHQDLKREYTESLAYVADKQHFGLLYPGGWFRFRKAPADHQPWMTVKKRYVPSRLG
jgi:hypothetical protein